MQNFTELELKLELLEMIHRVDMYYGTHHFDVPTRIDLVKEKWRDVTLMMNTFIVHIELNEKV
jgi:hypothetical protein